MNLFGELKWIDSYGGPFLLLEEQFLDKWRGVHVKDSRVLESDYDRACNIEDYVGLVSVGSDFGIVLGDEPLMTVWYSPEPNTGLIVRWVYAENEASVIASLANRQNVEWEKTELKVQLWDGELVLFDAACEGIDLPDKIKIEISAGDYQIETCHYKPNAETYLLLHRFVQF